MNTILKNIFSTGKFINSSGQEIVVNSATSSEQCEFLKQIIRQNQFNRSLEIGFAYGISTLAITEEVNKNGGRHSVIDKFQCSEWGGNGLDLLKQADLSSKLDFFEEYSYIVLPELLAKGKKIDFAYIDSTKVFDWLLVDFFLIDKMLDVNGIIVFDDAGYYSIRKLLRFISRLPHYRIESPFPFNVKPGLIERITGTLLTAPLLRNIFKGGLTFSDYKQGLNSGGCLAFRKIAEDTRDWKWHADF